MADDRTAAMPHKPGPQPGFAVAASVPAPAAAAPPQRSAVDLLLKVEADARHAETVGELEFLIANETMKLAQARQVFVLSVSGKRYRVQAVSSIGKVERNSPRIRWIENVIANLAADAGLQAPREFSLPAYSPPGDAEEKTFPYRFLVWLPLKLRDGHVFAGFLLAREVAWAEADIIVASRLADTYGHAWAALTGKRQLKRRPVFKPLLAVAAIAAIAAGFYPVPLTVLAPTEVRSISPRVVAAPLDGVIDTIEIEPNEAVTSGQILLRMSDTALRNELAVAEQDLKVSEARLKQISQAAIADPGARGDLAVARAETSLATAKRNYARELLDRSVVTAPAAGVALYSDKRDWIGRPVSTGERLMEIADPGNVQLRIDVPVADALAVRTGANVRAFLDSDPLRPLSAKVSSVSFEARMMDGNVLAYRLYADIENAAGHPQLGVRGTAQISGDRVPLAYYLFRRPIAALRQRFGV